MKMKGYSYTLKLNYFYHENDRIKECTIAKEIWDARGKMRKDEHSSED